MFEIDFDTRLN